MLRWVCLVCGLQAFFVIPGVAFPRFPSPLIVTDCLLHMHTFFWTIRACDDDI